MEKSGRPYDDVLKEAQRLGYAEADPASDVEGEDAAYKLALLARLAFGRDVAGRPDRARGDHAAPPVRLPLREAPRAHAAAARRRAGAAVGSDAPPLRADASRLRDVAPREGDGSVQRDRGARRRRAARSCFSGRGAGGDPTATAVLADVVEIARSPGEPRRAAARVRGSPAVRGGDAGGVRVGLSLCASSSATAPASSPTSRGSSPTTARTSRPSSRSPGTTRTRSRSSSRSSPSRGGRSTRALARIGRSPFHVVPPLALPLTD